MCRWNKSNVLEHVDSSDGSELEYESMVEIIWSFTTLPIWTGKTKYLSR